jgi:hypothetical protein
MDFAHHAKHVISDNADYRAALDEFRRPTAQGFDQFLLIHLRFYQFTKAAFAHLKHDWTVFRSVTDAPIFAHCDDDEAEPDKWARFVSQLGFQPVPDADIPAADGRSRRFFVSIKDFHGNAREDKHSNHRQFQDGPVEPTVPLPDAGVL